MCARPKAQFHHAVFPALRLPALPCSASPMCARPKAGKGMSLQHFVHLLSCGSYVLLLRSPLCRMISTCQAKGNSPTENTSERNQTPTNPSPSQDNEHHVYHWLVWFSKVLYPRASPASSNVLRKNFNHAIKLCFQHHTDNTTLSWMPHSLEILHAPQGISDDKGSHSSL
jgi:hypothetical protein